MGDQWQALLERRAIRESILMLRIPDGCKQIGPKKIIRVRSPLDYVMIKDGQTIFLDAKTINSDVISYSAIHSGKSTSHQVETCRNISLRGVRAGFLIWFRLSNYVSFIDAQFLAAIKPQEGIKYDAGLVLGRWEDFRLSPIFQLSFEHDLRTSADPMLV